MSKKLNLQITYIPKMYLIFNLFNLKINKTSYIKEKKSYYIINGKTNIILCNLNIKIHFS